jgi:ubiquinone/menaquinone biosynthesis C-methylase UbiE
MKNQKIWDFWASRYERLWVQKYSLKPTRQMIVEMMLSVFNKNSSINVLDVGCGTGQITDELMRHFNSLKYTGIDISESMIDKANIRKSEQIDFLVSNFEEFDISKRFDAIICSHAFPYFINKSDAIRKFYNLLEDGGTLFLANASTNNLYDLISLSFVKLTTSKAKYYSRKRTFDLLKSNGFIDLHIENIKEKFFMPSIYCIRAIKDELK